MTVYVCAGMLNVRHLNIISIELMLYIIESPITYFHFILLQMAGVFSKCIYTIQNAKAGYKTGLSIYTWLCSLV